MINYIIKTLQENSIAQGGLVIAIFSTCLFWVKGVPGKLFAWIQRYCTSYIRLDHHQKPLEWMLVWLGGTRYGKRTKHLTVCDDDGRLTVGSGRHIFWRKGSIVLVNYIRETLKIDGVPIGREESVEVRIIPGNRSVIEGILREAKMAFEIRHQNTTKIIMPRWNDWNIVDRIPKPSLDSVVLPKDQKTYLKDRLARFTENQDRCARLGVPWRLGLLLYGPPGNGKTSLAKAIAGSMSRDICILSLNGTTSDGELLKMTGVIPDNVVLLIEDIDVYNVGRDGSTKKDGITLSGLLNAIDGVTAKNGCITIMTTNHPEKLDPALIRKGRADVHLELTAPTEEQLVELFERFGHDYNGETFDNMASAQDYLLNNDENRGLLQYCSKS